MTLGWRIDVYVQDPREHVAGWRAHLGGLKMLDDLVEEGKAEVTGNAYPFVYRARAADIVPFVAGMPDLRQSSMHHADDVPGMGWWRIFADIDRINELDPGTMMSVVVWDES